MPVQPDAIRHTLVKGAVRFLPAVVIARVLVAQPQASRAMRFLISIRETTIARAVANVSQPDIQRVIEALEGEPDVAAWRDLLVWAKNHPGKTQAVVRHVMALAGITQ